MGARDHGSRHEDTATCVLRQVVRQLERHRDVDMGLMTSLVGGGNATPMKPSLVPEGMRAYVPRHRGGR